MFRRTTAVVAASAILFALAACDKDKKNGGAGTPPPVPKYTWPAPPESEKNPPQHEVAVLPPPVPPSICTSAEDPLPSGLSISFGAITGTVYSACRFPEAPISYTITLTILAKEADGTYVPVKHQDYNEIPVWLPEKSPYTVTSDCIPGTYALRMYVEGLGSDGKHFEAGPTQGGDFYVHAEDCP